MSFLRPLLEMKILLWGMYCNTLQHKLQHTATHTATHCNKLQHSATHCETQCNALQHTTLSPFLGTQWARDFQRNKTKPPLTSRDIYWHLVVLLSLQKTWYPSSSPFSKTRFSYEKHPATSCSTRQHTATRSFRQRHEAELLGLAYYHISVPDEHLGPVDLARLNPVDLHCMYFGWVVGTCHNS